MQWDQVRGLKYQRSVAMTTWWVRFVMFGLHVIIPELLGLGAFAFLLYPRETEG